MVFARSHIYAFFFFLVLCSTTSIAAEREEKLAAIRAEVDTHEAELVSLAERERVLEESVSTIERQAAELRRQEERLNAERERLEAVQEQHHADIARYEGEIAELESISRSRIRTLYQHRNETILERVILLGGAKSFSRNMYLFAKVRAYDEELIGRRRKLSEWRTEKIASLNTAIADGAAVKKKLLAKRAVLLDTKKKKKLVLGELRKTKDKTEEKIISLEAQALRLETVVASLTGKKRKSPKVNPVKQASGIKQKEIPPKKVGPFKGRGLFHQKGSLRVPVDGQLLKRYGRHRHTEFSDFVFSKGLEFRSEPGTNVRAIADGLVIHVGRMPAYGTIMIVDHGERYYSLYGRLDSPNYEVGNEVEKGEVLALTSEPDKQRRNFYFEVRKNGTPVNPQQFYSKKFATE